MTNAVTIEGELAAVLADRTFGRSPVLVRLLSYLVESTLAGKAKTLKSYSVAVEGLGRSPEPDPQVDTYARVQVTRLRKALETFYATAGKERRSRLTIDNGSYEVRLADNGGAAAAEVSRPAFRSSFPRLVRVLLVAGAIALLAFSIAAVLHSRSQSQDALRRWKTTNFPSVAVTVTDYRSGTAKGDYADAMRQQLLMRIGRYRGLRVQYDNPQNVTYGIDVKLYQAGSNVVANTFVVDRRTQRLIWSSANTLQTQTRDHSGGETEYVSQTAFMIAHGAGIIHAAERQLNNPVDTPYGCWLRFAMQVQDSRFTQDSLLSRCAEQWHDASPDDPIPAGLYAWTLLDQSITALSEGKREDLMARAIGALETARTLNPDSGFLPAIAVRAYALADEDPAMRAAAEQALRLNPGNLEVQGLIGTMLTFRNEPWGEALLDEAIAQRSNPPPWYFLAKFTAAMMREDTDGARLALDRLRHLKHFLPVVPICTAAYEARVGHVDLARAQWERAKAMQPILRISPDVFLGRTPLDSKTEARLKSWLDPVLR